MRILDAIWWFLAGAISVTALIQLFVGTRPHPLVLLAWVSIACIEHSRANMWMRKNG